MTDRKMPVKLARLKFDEEGYEGFECDRRLNLPLGTTRRIREAADEEESRLAMLEVFPEWNFVDEEGEEIPHTVEGFDKLPDDLWAAMVTRGFEALKEAAMPKNLESDSSRAEEDHLAATQTETGT
jgi:hypothetical protein